MMPDAFLLLSYGAPESEEDVRPFLDNLFAGKNVPEQRVRAAVEKYEQFAKHTGHFSPLGEECRQLIAGILRELNTDQRFRANVGAIPAVYWGNLFWHPILEDTVAAMARDGIRRAICLTTSAFDSGTTDRRYDEAIAAACRSVEAKGGLKAPLIERLALPFDQTLFIQAQTDRLLEALAWTELDTILENGSEIRLIGQIGPSNCKILFSAHSITKQDAAQSPYVEQLQQTCEAVMRQIAPESGSLPPWELVFQSRSGKVEDWLGPDIRDRVHEIAKDGQTRSIIVLPIGFFCENLETENDLDLEVGAICEKYGLAFTRARAVGASPRICQMICDVLFMSRSVNPVRES